MTAANVEKLESIIKPFDQKIQQFGKRVEETYLKGTQERSTLKEQLRQLMEANNQLSQDAIKLTEALRGDAQFQGSWGEIQLKRLLEKAGLEEGVHFTSQDSMSSENGGKLRTDFIIHLPEDKHLILDSKVSMVAFEQYYNADNDEERKKALKRHLTSVRNHINGLSEKNYPSANGINAPDYVLMFMPLEPAFIAAVQADPSLYESALEKNIAIVSASTLLATLRTIAYIWKSENQTRNVIEIAKEAGSLYDKFVGFLDNMQDLGKRLDSAQKEYNHAMNKLKTSPHGGSTLIGKVEKLRKLGAKTNKRISREYID
jgi:DNA recombination protein RmuC